MDPFVQAAKRFVTHSALAWKIGNGGNGGNGGKSPVLRAVAASDQRGDLVNALRWEEAQPKCRRPLIVVEEPFEEAKSYLEAVTRRVRDGDELLRTAANEAGLVLPEVGETISSEPVVRAVKTAEVAAAGLPPTLEGLTILLAPERVHDVPSWAIQVGALLKAATALSKTGNAARAQAVRWIVHDTPGGALASSLGEGVAFALDEGALFAWMKKASQGAERGSSKPEAATATAAAAPPPGEALSPDGAAELQRHVIAAAEALRAREPKRAIESFRAAQSICATEGRPVEEAGILLALAGALLAASAPGDAVAGYRTASEVAAKSEAWTLACQARLGEAGAELLQKHHREAAAAYVEAAELASKADVVALRVEALRMAGVCHLLGGDKQQAVRWWQTAVEAGLRLDAPAREPTSFAQVANDLVELLERLGMKVQAVDVRRRIAEESGASLEEVQESEAAAVSTTAQAADTDTTQAIRVFMPRKALPFVAGNVDLEWLDAMVKAAEVQATPRIATSVTEEIRVEPGMGAWPFETHDDGDTTTATQAIKLMPAASVVPFVQGTVDPALFRSPGDDTLDETLDGEQGATTSAAVEGAPLRTARRATAAPERAAREVLNRPDCQGEESRRMTTRGPGSGSMETIVRLRRGTLPRTVSIALSARFAGADPEAASRAFEVFTGGIDAGLSGREKVRLASATVHDHEQPGMYVESWVAWFPRISPCAFVTLARLAASAVPSASRLEIHELGDERLLGFRSFDQDTDVTIADVPWQISFVQAAESTLRLVFAEPIGAATVKRAATVLQAWADVLALGGFAGIDGAVGSAGWVSKVDATAERELVLGFDGLACGQDAWEALFEALIPVSEEAFIELVEIRGGVE